MNHNQKIFFDSMNLIKNIVGNHQNRLNILQIFNKGGEMISFTINLHVNLTNIKFLNNSLNNYGRNLFIYF